jgi:hypothetical protein
LGTNYYLRLPPICPTCHHAPEQLHIGKSSGGWTFSFHGTDEIRSYQDWLKVLPTGEIWNEYDEPVSLEEFQAMVEAKRGEKHNHTLYCRASAREWEREHGYSECWLDPDGHSFSSGTFS